MSFTSLPLFSLMAGKMAWLTRRTDVLAQNVANANTPGFAARDLEPVSFRELVARRQQTSQSASGLVTSHARHMSAIAPRRDLFSVKEVPDKRETTLSGNDVNVEQQLVSLSETQMSYQLTLNLYRKHLDMIRTAIGRGSR
ncbi:MAG: flagellar basal body rod protein FlgB [Alphaproteobacteria bacterium]